MLQKFSDVFACRNNDTWTVCARDLITYLDGVLRPWLENETAAAFKDRVDLFERVKALEVLLGELYMAGEPAQASRDTYGAKYRVEGRATNRQLMYRVLCNEDGRVVAEFYGAAERYAQDHARRLENDEGGY